MVLAGVGAFLWFHIGHADYYASEGDLRNTWWFATIMAVALGAGNSGGNDAVSVLMESIKGFVPALITLAVVGLVDGLLFQYIVSEAGLDPMGLVRFVAIFVAAGLLTSITMSFAKKSTA